MSKELEFSKLFYDMEPSYEDGNTLPWKVAQERNTKEWQEAAAEAKSRRSHYDFLDENFNTVLDRMGKGDLIDQFGNFSSSGDKYYQYRDQWAAAGIPFFHGAAMYHLMETFYSKEIRETRNGWVHPYQWVIDNYKSGHNLSQYMEGLS